MIYYLNRIIVKLKTLIYKSFYSGLFSGVILYDTPKIIHHRNVSFGTRTRINSLVFIQAAGGVNIGENVTLSYGTTILSTGYGLTNWEKNKHAKSHINKEINIKDNVWIGANVTVLSGITISEGVVVAAGSVVTKDLDCENALYAGVPAKKIKEL